MPYAQGRTYFDADSHVMELSDWLEQYADPGVREKIRPLYLGGAGALANEAVRQAEARRGDAAAAADLENNIMGAKGWHALGAFDKAERSRALDLLGFHRQLVFSTFAPGQFVSDDLELLYGGTRAHNRAMADFCADDERLIAVAWVPFADPELSAKAVREAIDFGCGAILVPSAPPKELSPFHPDFDPMWQVMDETGVPFMLHIGGGGRAIRKQFHNNDRPVSDFLGGGENVRGKDYIGLSHSAEAFLGSMIFDGMFDKFPNLRGGVIELGALWVPGWMRKLDIGASSFKKTEPTLRDLTKTPSEYIHERLWFTPFPQEPVGWLIEQCGDDLFLFSSDYPHPEGTRNPLERFESSLEGVGDEAKERFYSGNFAEMMGMAAVSV